MSYALDVAVAAYVVMALCVVFAEFSPWRKPAVASAFASIFFASVAGTAWCYAAFYTPPAWPEFAQPEKVANYGGPQKHIARKGQDGDEDEDDDDAQQGGRNREGNSDGEGGSGEGTGGGAIELIERASYGLARKTAKAIGLGEQSNAAPGYDGGIAKDCDDCPDLVTIPAGSAIIGATGSDGLAESAERPAVLRRFWPGFRIGREAVLATSFERFLDETMRPKQNCLAVVPDKPSPYARCVSAADADAYVAWLTGRTGKRYGLATAAEWEFAAKTAVTPIASLDDVPAAHSLRLGDVKEIVADCWQPFIPSIGNDILAADAGRFLCETRMVKGWTQQDAAKWRRVSVRREREKAAAPPDTGLRVVRSLD